jgi:hypothetical protein
MACGECASIVVAALEARLGREVRPKRRCKGRYFASTARASVSIVNTARPVLGQELAFWLAACS